MKSLLLAGADPTVPSLDGKTALLAALEEQHHATVRLLVHLYPAVLGDLPPELLRAPDTVRAKG